MELGVTASVGVKASVGVGREGFIGGLAELGELQGTRRGNFEVKLVPNV